MIDEAKFKLDQIYGHVRLVKTARIENGLLALGGYAIHYDMNGNEVCKTENTDYVRVFAS